MPEIKLTILKEDILLDNYEDSNNCPITKALKRAGYPELKDAGCIEGYLEGNYINIDCNINDTPDNPSDNQSYFQLLYKLFGMYNYLGNEYPSISNQFPKIELADFEHTIIF